jgi:acetyl esterase
MSVADPPGPRLVPEMAAIVAATPPGNSLTRENLAGTRRRAHAAMSAGHRRRVHELTDLDVPGPAGPIPVRVYRPHPGEGLPVLVFAHGGGWVMGGLDTHDALCREIAVRAGTVVVSVDYRLAPEHPFPASLEDFHAAARWVAGNASRVGGDPERVAVGGDSAGGNLAAAVCLLARDRGGPHFAAQWLAYPGLDGTSTRASWTVYADGPLLSVDNARAMWRMYAGGADLRDPYLSPLHARSLTGLPPALIVAPRHDHGHDDAVAYARRLREDGVPVRFESCEGLCHGFLSHVAHVPAASQVLDLCCDHLRRVLGAG